MASKRRGKKNHPSGRPDVPATHGRDQFATPPKSAVKPPQRLPGHGMR
ncbi:MAG: hypothetical protein ABSB24_12630 [Gaiellaceae bacterium]|jgi:hypothetical protein